MKHSRDGMGEGAERYYVLETTRAQATGWLNLDEGTYYFDETGEMLLGWQTIDGFRYYFESDGTMASANRRSMKSAGTSRKMAGCSADGRKMPCMMNMAF